MAALNSNKVDTVVVPSMDNSGISIEEHFKKNNLVIPGSSASFYYENVHIGSKLKRKIDKNTMLAA